MKNKVVIVGCGNVGMSYAYSLINGKTSVNELVLIDINKEKALGEAMDLNHGLPFGPSKIDIRTGDYIDCKDAKIVMIAAGRNQDVGETRMDLIDKNSKIFKSIVGDVMASGFNGIFVVATNPLDVMTYLTWKYSGLPTNQIIGSGTSLDTARLRYMLGEELHVNPKNIHAYVVGEHGDSEFVPWNCATVGPEPLRNYLTDDILEKIHVSVRDAAYEIIERKGATYYGIGMCLTRITNAILNNECSIITVSTFHQESGIFIGQPAILNKNGIKGIAKLSLTFDEQEKFNHSINVIKEAIDNLYLLFFFFH
jgi:L-lactate dehydrogenase